MENHAARRPPADRAGQADDADRAGEAEKADRAGEAEKAESDERLDRPLPDAVRQRVVEVAAALIGSVPPDEVPPPLRRVARFEPRRRAKLAATPIAAQLESDTGFRERVADAVARSNPELAETLDAGSVPPAADPVQIAVLAYLLRPAGWTRHIDAARDELARSVAMAEEAGAAREVAALKEQLAAARSGHGEELQRLRSELREAKDELATLRKKLHEARTKARRQEERAEELTRISEEERTAAVAAASTAEAEMRRLRAKLSSAENAAEDARRAAREGRNVDEMRLRVLLDALSDVTKGLRSELALSAGITRPADAVGAVAPPRPDHRTMPGRALSDDDPALLDQLLMLPQVHLIVDGYNVTKTGYGELPLADQRARLLVGLGGLHAQTKAEVTCVFDGAELDARIAVAAPRGVRVLFSAAGQTADELIGRLVRAEPPGRAVVVVSSDREVEDSARRGGARPASAMLLLRRLGR